MSTRARIRRKVVLAVTVSRCNGHDKQIAHTLNITSTTAQLGGISTRFEPGEIIDIQRGAIKGRFEVVWMGKPGSFTDRQMGVRSVDPNKVIWGVDLPNDESDGDVNITHARKTRHSPPKAHAHGAGAHPLSKSKVVDPVLEIEAQPARVLIAVCKALAGSFDAWATGSSAAEMEELRQAVIRLQHRLTPSIEVDLEAVFAASVQTSGQA
jgi:hypothetical protein